MKFYVFKFSKKTITIALFLVILFICTSLKMSDLNVPVLGRGEPIYEGAKNKKIMAFTCNVAWGNEYIPKLLEIFEEKDVKITFFIEGRWADKFPELLRLIESKGHEIGNHGYSHAHHAQLSLEQNINEIKKTEKTIEEIINKKTSLFAPPYGEFSDNTVKATNELDYKLIMWTIDTIDWKKPGVDYIINKVLDNAGNGKIVLMHPTEDTVRALPTIIDNLKKDGYKISTVSDVLE